MAALTRSDGIRWQAMGAALLLLGAAVLLLDAGTVAAASLLAAGPAAVMVGERIAAAAR